MSSPYDPYHGNTCFEQLAFIQGRRLVEHVFLEYELSIVKGCLSHFRRVGLQLDEALTTQLYGREGQEPLVESHQTAQRYLNRHEHAPKHEQLIYVIWYLVELRAGGQELHTYSWFGYMTREDYPVVALSGYNAGSEPTITGRYLSVLATTGRTTPLPGTLACVVLYQQGEITAGSVNRLSRPPVLVGFDPASMRVRAIARPRVLYSEAAHVTQTTNKCVALAVGRRSRLGHRTEGYGVDPCLFPTPPECYADSIEVLGAPTRRKRNWALRLRVESRIPSGYALTTVVRNRLRRGPRKYEWFMTSDSVTPLAKGSVAGGRRKGQAEAEALTLVMITFAVVTEGSEPSYSERDSAPDLVLACGGRAIGKTVIPALIPVPPQPPTPHKSTYDERGHQEHPPHYRRTPTRPVENRLDLRSVYVDVRCNACDVYWLGKEQSGEPGHVEAANGTRFEWEEGAKEAQEKPRIRLSRAYADRALVEFAVVADGQGWSYGVEEGGFLRASRLRERACMRNLRLSPYRERDAGRAV
ncbi:hypothetical protein FIBSPDRAFT_889021 [Athelia psychrophila]|uniref:Uncharacterized protein n=1 Tax=Athelia psychrophila TaxID=1759441 RepID=A0A166MU88_9AGAM|nr:hypothetical protein FIBSPDRAFT_889021 [Fibularhizoctonia sp. CBS 109695]